MNPYLVGITGGSASGKTHLLDQICGNFSKDDITLISQDDYYKDFEDQEKDEDGNVNFDHPDSVRLDLLAEDLVKVLNGSVVHKKKYTFNNPAIPEQMLEYKPAPIIIVEGLFVFFNKKLNRLFDLKIFIEVDEHIKLTRRIRRDHSDRGYSLEDILWQYNQFVVPMYRKFIEPYKYEADIILPNNKHPEKGILLINDHLKMRLNNN